MPLARWLTREMLLRIVGLVLFDVFGLLLVTCSASMLVHGTLESVWFLCRFGAPGVIVGNVLVYCVLAEINLCFYTKYVIHITSGCIRHGSSRVRRTSYCVLAEIIICFYAKYVIYICLLYTSDAADE